MVKQEPKAWFRQISETTVIVLATLHSHTCLSAGKDSLMSTDIPCSSVPRVSVLLAKKSHAHAPIWSCSLLKPIPGRGTDISMKFSTVVSHSWLYRLMHCIVTLCPTLWLFQIAAVVVLHNSCRWPSLPQLLLLLWCKVDSFNNSIYFKTHNGPASLTDAEIGI